ncbi:MULTISPECIES: hypothetical protein [unclassified Gilliamella]|uniref:hypothetical protein n=1 Tax=unclassified Gilliamella TaxID=2685620 RepID=UPI00226AE6DA|nr:MULTISPECIES: hypothetical protein [unclassified Gilliamella]MCX8585828.1 hypothetical protein [Gilliamella sp. B3562]MCX8684866.1 hypothetical protein [Gilliamella sp. B2864]
MENRTFEFRCFTRRSFISLMILIFCFGVLVFGCLLYLFALFFSEMIPNQYFEIIFIVGLLVPELFSVFLFAICIARLFRKKMTIDVNSYSINIDDHKKLNQTFQWSALQTVMMFKSTVVLYHTIILEFDSKLINMMVAKTIYLSKKDIDQFLQFIQYVDEQIIKPDFTLSSSDTTLSTKLTQELTKALTNKNYDHGEYRYLYVRK